MNPPRSDDLIAEVRPADSPPARWQQGGATPLLALLVLLLATLLLYWFDKRQKVELGVPPVAARATLPVARFTEISSEASVAFTHRNGATVEKLLPETMGGGCAFFDFDADGDQDLLLIDSGDWAWAPNPQAAKHALYRNDGRGSFEDVTAGSGLDSLNFYGMGVATGDFDNDGSVDLFITGLHANRLLRNVGSGKFQDVTTAAGIAAQHDAWSTSAAWVDIDNDGDLDLFVCNYVQWTREIDQKINYQLAGIGRAYGPPMSYTGSFPFLYRNEGNGRFTDVSAPSGVQVRNRATGQPFAKSLGISPVDIDGDHWIDLIVANDTVQNFVFHNQRNGTFKEIGAVSGIAFDVYGSPRGAMGIDSGRFEDESALGVSIGNFANEMTALYVSRQNPLLFSDEAVTQGVGAASRDFLSFGVFFFDYDLDGWLDLLIANGHIEPEIEKAGRSQQYKQAAGLFWNARSLGARAGFRLVPAEKCGADLLEPITGRGSAYADIDSDGDLDVVMTQVGGPVRVFRNDQNLRRHSLRLKLVGKTSNRDAIGAVVRVRIGKRALIQQVMPTKGYLSQSELPLTFGLGGSAVVDEVVVTWPGGAQQTVVEPRTDYLNVVTQQ